MMTYLDLLQALEDVSAILSISGQRGAFAALHTADRAIEKARASLDDQAPKVADLDEQDQIMLDAAHWDEMHERA